MIGKIEKIWENETSEGKEYRVLVIEGQKYSLWNSNYFDKIQQGDYVEYDFKQSGDFFNLTKISNLEQELEKLRSRESEKIIRMSSLKSASEILSRYGGGLEDKLEMALNTAKKFERYIKGEKEIEVVLEESENEQEF